MEVPQRRAGLPTKRSAKNPVTLNLLAELKVRGFEPAAELLKVIRRAWEELDAADEAKEIALQDDSDLKPEAKISALLSHKNEVHRNLHLIRQTTADLMQYAYPKLKAIEVRASDEDGKLFASFSAVMAELGKLDKE